MERIGGIFQFVEKSNTTFLPIHRKAFAGVKKRNSNEKRPFQEK